MIQNGKIIASMGGSTILRDNKAETIGGVIKGIHFVNRRGVFSIVNVVYLFPSFPKLTIDLFFFDYVNDQLIAYKFGKETTNKFKEMYCNLLCKSDTIYFSDFINEFTGQYISYTLMNAK